jgi:hypothetical protein
MLRLYCPDSVLYTNVFVCYRRWYFRRDRIESIEQGWHVIRYGIWWIYGDVSVSSHHRACDVYLSAGFHPIKAAASDSNIFPIGIRLDKTYHTLQVGEHTWPALHFL